MPPTTTLPVLSTVIQPGDSAPDFTLTDQDRQEWTLSKELEKGPVVLCFYPLAFTGVCGTEMECVTKEFDRWSKEGMQIVGVSCDSFATQKAWADQMGFKHRLLADMHRAVCKGYGLFWNDLNVSSRGTVVIEKNASDQPTVTWSQSRQPGQAMDFEAVMSAALNA